MVGLGLYGAEHSKCDHMMTLGFKGLTMKSVCDSVWCFLQHYNYQCDVAGDLDNKRTMLTTLRHVTPTEDMADRKQREHSRKTRAKHRGRTVAHVGHLDRSLGAGLLSRPWKRLFGVSTDVSLPR